MKFRKSIGIVNSCLIYLPFLALSKIWIKTELYSTLSSVLLSSFLFVIVYGRIVEIIKENNKSSWSALIARNWCNYFAVILILGLPVFALSFVYSEKDSMTQTISNNVIGALIICLTIYVWPLVFFEHQAITSIRQGIILLFNNFRKSILLILLSISAVAIKTLVYLSVPFFTYRLFWLQNYIVKMIGIGFLQNLIIIYIDLLVFAMAAIFVIEEGKVINEEGIQISNNCLHTDAE